MGVLSKLRSHLSRLDPLRETEPRDAYDTWSLSYDDQPDNLMLALDEALFNELTAKIEFINKTVVDIGCGTGRHWEKIAAKYPARIIGFDVSEGMLKILKQKYPHAETHLLSTNRLDTLCNESCDIIISTLTIAHIESIEESFTEWARVLKTTGHIIITDYHPDALLKGGNRTFRHLGKLVSVKNYIHPIAKIQGILNKQNLKMDDLTERKIDDSVKHYYEKQNALKVFEQYKGTAIIYGVHITKKDAAK
jgi:ubiquinone/menaquinone biosynthesis C-methylase UbiE